MITVVLVIHLLIALALVGVILLQRSEGGALGIGGGGSGLVSGRAAGNILTRATALLAVAFFSTSMILAIMAGGGRNTSILDVSEPGFPASVDLAPQEPSAPVSR